MTSWRKTDVLRCQIKNIIQTWYAEYNEPNGFAIWFYERNRDPKYVGEITSIYGKLCKFLEEIEDKL